MKEKPTKMKTANKAPRKSRKGVSGRPTKYKEEYCEQARKFCLLGATNEDLANFLDVNQDTVREWRNKYPDFSAAIKEGKEGADSNVAQSLYQSALEGNPTSMIFWLKNRRKLHWRDKQEIEHGGKVSHTLMDMIKDAQEKA